MIETNGLQAVATTAATLHELPERPGHWTGGTRANAHPESAGHATAHPARSKEHSP